jgi:hypothetical protein
MKALTVIKHGRSTKDGNEVIEFQPGDDIPSNLLDEIEPEAVSDDPRVLAAYGIDVVGDQADRIRELEEELARLRAYVPNAGAPTPGDAAEALLITNTPDGDPSEFEERLRGDAEEAAPVEIVDASNTSETAPPTDKPKPAADKDKGK